MRAVGSGYADRGALVVKSDSGMQRKAKMESKVLNYSARLIFGSFNNRWQLCANKTVFKQLGRVTYVR